MDTETRLITLTGPAKVNRVYRRAGDPAIVTRGQLVQLIDAGAAPVGALSLFDVDTPLAGDFDAAVAAAIAEREANWSTAMDHFETMAEDRQAAAIDALKAAHAIEVNQTEQRKYAAADQSVVDALTAERARTAELNAQVSTAATRISDLEAQLAAANDKAAKKPVTPK